MSKPIICFAHGNGIPAGTYQKMFEVWQPYFEVLYISQIGHNLAYPVNDGWGNLVDELINKIESEASKPVIGIGHSLGATLTFMAAYKRPDLFCKIILLDPPLLVGLDAFMYSLMKRIGQGERFTPAARSRGRRETWNNKEEALAYFKSKTLFKKFDPDCLQAYVDSGTKSFNGGIRLSFKVEIELAIFNTIPLSLNRWNVQNHTVSSILIKGQDSNVTIPKYVNSFAKRYKMNVITMFGGHMFPLEDPLGVAKRINQLVLDV